MKQIFSFLFLVAFSTAFCQIDTDTAYVIIDMGQSNSMGAYSNLPTLEKSYYNPANVSIWTGHAFEAVNSYQNNNQQPSNMKDSSFAYGSYLMPMIQHYTGRNVYDIHYAVGGSIVYDTTWNGGRCWHPDRTGEIYDSAVANINRAKQWFVDNNITYILLGCVWNQWESDANLLQAANNYTASLDTFFTHLRADISEPDLYLYVCKPSDNATGSYMTYKTTVETQQAAYVLSDAKSELVSQDGAEFISDNIHFNSLGYMLVAQNLFNAIKPNLRRQKIGF
jgi:hypothetical protein